MTSVPPVAEELLLRLGALARRIEDPREFLTCALALVTTRIGASAGALYLKFDSVALSSRMSRDRAQVHPVYVFSASSAKGEGERFVPILELPDPSGDGGCVVHPLRVEPARAFAAHATGAGVGVEGLLLLESAHASGAQGAEVVQHLMPDFMLMLEAVLERSIYSQIVAFNERALYLLEAQLNDISSEILEVINQEMATVGLSFLHVDNLEEAKSFAIEASFPNKLPPERITYARGDGTVTGQLVSRATSTIVYYDTLTRSQLPDYRPSRWRDIPGDQTTRCILYVPIMRRGNVVGFLRVSNRLARGAPCFDLIDVRTAEAYATMFVTWFYLLQKERKVGERLQIAFHEVRTTCMGIGSAGDYVLGQLERVRTPPKEIDLEEVRHKVRHVIDSSRSISTFVELLVLNEITHVPPRPSAAVPAGRPGARDFLPYAEVAKPISEEYYALARKRGIVFRHYGETKFPAVCCNKASFETVFRNLIHNAVKYTKTGAPIHILYQAAEARRPFHRLVVASDSLEISEEERKNLFHPKFRGAAAVASGQPGDGHGLAIAQQMAQVFGGTVVYKKGRLSEEPGSPELNIFALLIPREISL